MNARTAYDDPGALLMRLRMEEPEEFAACAGAGVQGWCPIWPSSGGAYLIAARERGEIHADTDIAEASEWVARVLHLARDRARRHLDPTDRATQCARMCGAT